MMKYLEIKEKQKYKKLIRWQATNMQTQHPKLCDSHTSMTRCLEVAYKHPLLTTKKANKIHLMTKASYSKLKTNSAS